jgi:hypothetical protein
MLAKRRTIQAGGEEARTPLIVPSFSSRGFPDVSKIIETTAEVLDSAILVSAYDIHYKKISPPFDFPSLIFLDSGGYEASKETDLSDLAYRESAADKWTQAFHEGVVSKWKSRVPTVLISYDHPKERLPIRKQIDRAKRMAPSVTGVLREILIKPEKPGQTLIQMESLLSNARALAAFDVVGVTEKEIGNSILVRMENIAKLRLALDKVALDKPIHVFGSLDPVSTPMYFLAGADIFDGLTWPRFAYKDGYAVYKHNYGATDLGVGEKAHLVDGRCWYHNYRYLKDLELQMRRFLKSNDFGELKYHTDLFREAYGTVAEAVEQ